MRCPKLSEIPPPPVGKTGWPWTVENPQLPDAMLDGRPWPCISIVTPSYNQGRFIEETIRSVLLQGYPDLEYIIIDGESTDNSVEIVKKYEPWLTYWVSEKDRGQAHAINKGIERSAGRIFNWINSDDVVAQGALREVATLFAKENGDCVAGLVVNFSSPDDIQAIPNANLTAAGMITAVPDLSFHQPGIWLLRERLLGCGGIDEAFCYVFDWDLIIRYLFLAEKVSYTDQTLVYFRLHPRSKTLSNPGHWEEKEAVLRKLQVDQKFVGLHKLVSVQLSKMLWHKEVDQLRFQSSLTKFKKISRIAISVCRRPTSRLNRYAFGAIRRIINERTC